MVNDSSMMILSLTLTIFLSSFSVTLAFVTAPSRLHLLQQRQSYGNGDTTTPTPLPSAAAPPPPHFAAADSLTCPHRMISLRIATQKSGSSHQHNKNAFEDILEDEEGHINPELAKLIWKWEKQQRLNLDLPDFQTFSTRDGLRWVKEMVDNTLGGGPSGGTTSTMATTTTQTAKASSTSSTNSRSHSFSSVSSYDDLIQEGVMALMQALKSFEHDAKPNETLEMFAKAKIQRALLHEISGAKGTTSAGANNHNAQSRQRPPLSMESTVEIADPLETGQHYYLNQDEWEVREGLVLDNGQSVKKEELVEEYLDESLQYEGEDQMWIHQQSVAAPLRDSIPEEDGDTNWESLLENPTSPDDLALTDMILYNVDDFLDKTLDDIESQIIQMRFGLDDGEPKTQKDIAYGLGLTVSKVRKLQKRALEKLRAAFTDRYASDDTSHEDYWEDTV
jgi:RNA polymerase sigma factor (sigma-70 family)